MTESQQCNIKCLSEETRDKNHLRTVSEAVAEINQLHPYSGPKSSPAWTDLKPSVLCVSGTAQLLRQDTNCFLNHKGLKPFRADKYNPPQLDIFLCCKSQAYKSKCIMELSF